MNTSASQLQNHRSGATILAWPHKEPNISLTEIEVREKVISILAAELGLNAIQIQGDTLIKEDLGADWFDLTVPIMTIENYFRTLLQEEAAGGRLTIDTIIDKLMGRVGPATAH